MADIYILAGQSNMAGRGDLSEAITSNSNILMLLGDALVPAREPLHVHADGSDVRARVGSVSKAPPGVGPGLAFADEMLTLTGGPRPLVLVPSAVGATGIGLWAPHGHLHVRMMQDTARAMDLCKTRFGDASVRGFLFYQGETDAVLAQDAAAYEDKLTSLARAVRHTWPDVIMVVVLIEGSMRRIPHRDTVRAAQTQVCKAMHVPTYDARGYDLQEDGLHLTAAAQHALGRSLARLVHAQRRQNQSDVTLAASAEAAKC